MKRRDLFKSIGLIPFLPIVTKGKLYTKDELIKIYNKPYKSVVYEDCNLDLHIVFIEDCRQNVLGFSIKINKHIYFKKIRNSNYYTRMTKNDRRTEEKVQSGKGIA